MEQPLKQSQQNFSSIRPLSLRYQNMNEQNVQKTIIADLPQSVDIGEKLKQKDLQIQRLTHALQYYRKFQSQNAITNILSRHTISQKLNQKQQNSKNPSEFMMNLQRFQQQIVQLIEKSSYSQKLNAQNLQLSKQVRALQQQISELKSSLMKDKMSDKNFNIQLYRSSQIQTNKLKQLLWSLQSEINRLNYENRQLKRSLHLLNQIKTDKINPSNQIVQKHFQTSQQHLINIKANQINIKNNNQMLIRQRQKQYQSLQRNSISLLDQLDLQRYQLKLAQKNKQYQDLFVKYQQIETENIHLQQQNEQIQRERLFLAERLGEIEILQQGDEVVGEMENKLVLMSTELMRLGNINRNKLRQTQQLNVKLKQTIHKLELSSKENIQKQKIILNYKEQLAIMQKFIERKRVFGSEQFQKVQELKSSILLKQKQLSRLNYLKQQLEEENKTYLLKLKVYQQKISRLQQENKQLQKQYNEIQKSTVIKSQSHIFTTNLQIQTYKSTINGYQKQHKQQLQKINSLKIQLNTLYTNITVLENKNKQLQLTNSSLQSNIRKYEFTVEDKDAQIRDIRHEYEQKLIAKNEEIRKVSERLTIMEKNKDTLMKSPKKNQQELQMIETIHKLEEQNMLLRIQLNRHQEIVTKLRYEIQTQSTALRSINKQIESIQVLNRQLREKDKELKDQKRQLEIVVNEKRRVETEREMYERRNTELMQENRHLMSYENKARELKDQLEILKTQLNIKTQQCHNLQNKLYQITNQTTSRTDRYNKNEEIKLTLQKQIETKYSQQISTLRQELQRLKQQQQKNLSNNKTNQNKETESYIHEQLSEEIIRLNSVLSERLSDILLLQRELELAKHKLAKCEELLLTQRQSKISNIHSIIHSQTSLVEDKSRVRNNDTNSETEFLLREKVKLLKQANDKLEMKLQQTVKEKLILQHKLSQIQYLRQERSMVHNEKQTHLTLLLQEIRVSNLRLQQSMRQVDNYYLDKMREKQQEYEQKERQMKQEIVKLEFKLSQCEMKIRQIESGESFNRNGDGRNRSESRLLIEEQNGKLASINYEYESKLALLSQQLERSEMLISEKSQQIIRLESKCLKIQENNRELMIENQTGKNTIEILSQQIQRLSEVMAHNIQQIQQADRTIKALAQQVELKSKQNEHLRGENQAIRRGNIQSQRGLIQNESRQLVRRLQMSQSEILQIKNLNNNLKQQLSLMNRKKISLQQHIEKLEQNNLQLKQQLTQMRQENTKYESQQSTVNQFKSNQSLISQQKQQITQLKHKISQFQERIIQYQVKGRQSQKFQELKEEIQQLKESNVKLQAKFELILSENQKLVYQVESFKRNKSTSISSTKTITNDNTNRQITNDNNTNTNNKTNNRYEQQLASYRETISKLSKQLHQVQVKLIENSKFKVIAQTYEQQMTQLEAQHHSMNKQKQALKQQYQQLQNQYQSQSKQFKTTTDKLNQALQQIDTLNGRNAQTNSKNSKGNTSSSHIKTQLYTKTIKMSSIDEVDEKQQRSRGPSLYHSDKQLTPKEKQYIQRYQLLEQICKKLKKQNQCYRKKSIEYQFKMNKLKEEFDLLSKLVNQYRDENQLLKNQLKLLKYQRSSDANIKQSPSSFSSVTHNTSHNHFTSLQANSTQMKLRPTSPVSQIMPTSNHVNFKPISPNSSNINPLSPHTNMNVRPSSPNITIKPISPNATTKTIINEKSPPTSYTQKQSNSSQQISTSQIKINHNYNQIKQSMEQINSQLSHLHNNQQQSTMITLPIDQIHMLINQIQRLFAENKSLSEQLNDSSVMLIEQRSGKSRYEENLATFVIMIVEIQALRHRVAVAEAERQQMRRQGLSPTRSSYK